MGSEVEEKERLLQLARRLAVKRGMGLGTLDTVELALLLTALTQTIAPDERFSEKQFNQRLTQWLAQDGRSVRTDYAELRRTLVDLQFIQRDAFGKVYQRAPAWPVHLAAVCSAIESADLRAVMADAQADEARRREERKRRALSRA